MSRKWIKAEHIETKTIGNYHGTIHHLALFFRIVSLIERIVRSKIFVKTDAQEIAAHDDALVKRAYLRIDLGNIHRRHHVSQVLKGFGQFIVQIVDVLVLPLHLDDHALQRSILEKRVELAVDAGVVHMPQLQHIFYQRARLAGIVGVHLLQGRAVARSQEEAFYAVVAMNADSLFVSISMLGIQLPLTTDANHHGKNQCSIQLLHATDRINVLRFANIA